MGSINNADIWILSLCCGNFISVELMRNEIEINSLCKDLEISCCRFYGLINTASQGHWRNLGYS